MASTELTYNKYEFFISPEDTLHLPSYKGSTFRGGFGHAFKKIVCALRHKECSECIVAQSCIYAYVFETRPPADAEIMKKYSSIPHPFIIEPPDTKQQEFKSPEILTFGLVLIGKAIDYLPYFVYAFTELGKMGIGKGRGKYKLIKVESQGQVLYQSDSKRLLPSELQRLNVSFNNEETETDSLRLRFHTPVRILYGRSLAGSMEFHYIIRNLLRRLSLFSYFHCSGTQPELDYKGLIEEAEAVICNNHSLRWHDWERYSTRQETKMKLGGLVGDVSFTGLLAKFRPLLRAGEILHVGKGSAFGLGRYEILL